MRRCMLFMPANNPGNIINADVFGADSVILDLEDAVSSAEKDAARILARNALAEMDFGRTEVIIRINGLDTPFWRDDLRTMVPLRPGAVMPPKVHGPEDVRTISAFIHEIERDHGMESGGVRLIPLVESARGVEAAGGIARADDRVDALYFGAEDLALNLRAKRTLGGQEILYCRSRVVLAARAAGIDALDTPCIDIRNDALLLEDARLARSLGFSGKAAIYPLQVEIINDVFSPTRDEYLNAVEALQAVRDAEAKGKGVTTLNGKILDGPLVDMARNTVEEYETIMEGTKRCAAK